jgi:hypothetical protein
MKYEFFHEGYERGYNAEMSEAEMKDFLKRNLMYIARDESGQVYASKETGFYHEYENVKYID